MSRMKQYIASGNLNPSTEKQPSITATVLCAIRRLVRGLPKVGKTYDDLKRAYKLKDMLTIIIGLVDKKAKTQCKDQCLEIGYKEEDIWLVNELPKTNSKGYKDFRGKIVIVNLHEAYDTRVSQLINDSHAQTVDINFIIDEYDLIACPLQMKKWMSRWEKLNGWIGALKKADHFTLISATNAVAYQVPFKFTETKKVLPYKPGYYAPKDCRIRVISDSEKDELVAGSIPSSIINRIKQDNNPKEKALLKFTNRVNPNKEHLYHNKIRHALEGVGINTVCFNGQEEYTQEEYNNATAVVAGQLANRNAMLEDLTDQYIIFGKNATVQSIIQPLRVCGYRTKQPTIYVPESLKEKLVEAIKFENMLYEEEKVWYEYPRPPLEAHACLNLYDSKIDGISKTKVNHRPAEIIELNQYSDTIENLFPMIDELKYDQLTGTRIYQHRSAKQICYDTINTSPTKASRIQPDRNMFLPKDDWNIPKEGELGTTLTMGINYNEQINCASYWIEENEFNQPIIKIVLWQNLNKQEEKNYYTYNIPKNEETHEQTSSRQTPK